MKIATKANTLVLASALLGAGIAGAEDIDIYQGDVATTGNVPNVLIILDNSANWSRNNQNWPEGKQGDAELIALERVISRLNNVRVGLMMFTKGSGNEYGYLRYGIREMTPANRSKLQELMAGIRQDGVNSNEQKTAQANYTNAMYEAYRYFSGMTRYGTLDANSDYAGNGSYNIAPYKAGNIAGNPLADNQATTKYSPPLSANSACAPNFIVFIGNGFPSGDGDATTQAGAGLPNFDATQIYSSQKNNWADEWARYLNQYGVNVSQMCQEQDGVQVCPDGKITTYTIDVYKDQQDMEQTKLFRSMATVGGGQYHAATNLAQIEFALTDIFNQIQAVNSVFASSSLPVSVNTQGTYLNQIYMGVFRPDEKKNPRWLGNLKQYKFAIQTNDDGDREIFLADADGKAAVNPLTGFIKTDVRSFWSKTVAADSAFWKFRPNGEGKAQDAPDGDLVEKGAAAQRLRSLGPTDRKVYTCTSNCEADLPPENFSTANGTLVSTLTGTESAVTLTRVGTTVTGTSTTNLALLAPTDTITIGGSNVAAYNGIWSVNKGDGNTFSFNISETPVSPATGTITVSAGTSVTQNVGSLNFNASTGKVTAHLPLHGFVNNQQVTITGADVSAAMSSANIKCAGWPSTANCEYNGTFAITVLDANNFTYTPSYTNFGANQDSTTQADPPLSLTTPGQTIISCKNGVTNASITNTSVTRTAAAIGATTRVTVRLDSTPDGCTLPLALGNGNGRVTALRISGSSSDYVNITPSSIAAGTSCHGSGTDDQRKNDFCFDITVRSSTVVTSTTTIIPASPATGSIRATGIPTRNVATMTRTAGNASNVATVTIKTTEAHGFSGSSVQVNGADQPEYNGTKTVTYPAADEIRFTLTTGPTASASGTASKGSSVPATPLINWIRGVDNKDDENVNGSFTDVRASIHGDVLHSRPLLINYGGSPPLIMAYYGTNGGTFHAVQVGDDESADSVHGKEKWSFVAPEHFSRLGRLYSNAPKIFYPDLDNADDAIRRDYFFDGNIGAYQSADLQTTHIYISMRRGGRVIYALDVSDPNEPKYLWKRSNADETEAQPQWKEMGQTWSEPKFITIKKTAGVDCRLNDETTFVRGLVFGGGYDPAEEDKASGAVRTPQTGRGVFVLDATDGSLIKLLQAPLANGTRYSFAGELTLIDSDKDGCVDRIYGADTGANIYRFDIGDPNYANWKVYHVAKLGDVGHNGGSDDRKFLYRPDAVFVDSFVEADGTPTRVTTTYLMVGSGNREDPRSKVVRDAFFMVKDGIVAGTDPATVTPVKIGDTGFKEITFGPDAEILTKESVIGPEVTGWYLFFDEGEKTVNAPLTLAGITYFGTNLPKEATAQCTPNLGTARGYAINFVTGTPSFDRDGNGTYSRSDLYGNIIGGGLPPSPVSGTVCIGDECPRFCIGCCVGPDCASIEGSKITATPDPRRRRIYWYFNKDQ